MRIVLVLAMLAMMLMACGEAAEETPAAEENTSAEETPADVVEEVEEVVEEVVEAAPVALPEPWPVDFVLPANMVIVEETTDENGNPVIIANYPDGVERLNIWDLSDHFYEGPMRETWDILEVEDGFNNFCTDFEFYTGLTCDQGNILCDGFWDEANLLSVKLTWEQPE